MFTTFSGYVHYEEYYHYPHTYLYFPYRFVAPSIIHEKSHTSFHVHNVNIVFSACSLQEDTKEYKNLFTSDGLCPALKDLEQMFDTSDDATSGDETVRLVSVHPSL